LSRIAVVITYSPAPVPPTVTTNAATFVAATSSVLNGSSNPNGFATTAWFRFSSTNPGTCDNSFGTRVPSSGGTALGAGTSSVAFSNGTPTLATGTTYYYCAIASSTGGIVFGNIVSFTTLNPSVPPAAPSFLTLLTWSTSTPPEVFVNWIDNSNNETGFNVERGTDGINFTLIATTTFNSPHFTDIVSTGSSYYYRVQAFNAFGTSSYSNVASTTL
jgi:hypothetical protein